MRKDIEEPMSEGTEQITSDLAKVVRGDVFADECKRQRKTLKREFLGRVKILDDTLS